MMKKTLFIGIVFALFPVSALAVEGTCSWHGGVDCTAGSDWDGSTICNDGWRDSTEQFYSTAECTQNLHHCSSEVSAQLNVKYQLDSLSQKVSEACDLPSDLLPSPSDTIQVTREKAIKSLQLSSVCNTATIYFQSALNQYNSECYSIGESEYYKAINDFRLNQLKQLEELYSSQSAPTYACGPHSSLVNTTQCQCDSGYFNYKNSCVLLSDWCALTYGPHAVAAPNNMCACASGYSMDTSISKCVLSLTTDVLHADAPAAAPKEKSLSTSVKDAKNVVNSSSEHGVVYWSSKPLSNASSTLNKYTGVNTESENVHVNPRESILSRLTVWFIRLFK